MSCEFGVESNVKFHGKKSIGPVLNAVYQSCDIYVIPSYHEDLPKTIWEAMANGMPVIATKVGAIPEYLTNEKNVVLIEPKYVAEIVKMLKKL
jgi:glycosyltransferase involved in cell wall biosynthesis